MTDIILSTQNGEPVASSRQIAENFGKEHKHVLDAVKIWWPKIRLPNPCSTRQRLRTAANSTPCT